jgi:hypothetical protein
VRRRRPQLKRNPLGGPTRSSVIQALAFALLVVVMTELGYRGLHRARARAIAATTSHRWEPVRLAIDNLLSDRMGTSLVLVTGYRMQSHEAAEDLSRRLKARWSDRVELEWRDGRPDPHWAVVTTTETTVVTPLLGRQWLTWMRTVCARERCRISHFGVVWGGSPPTAAPVFTYPI